MRRNVCRALAVFPSPLWFSGWCFPEMEVDSNRGHKRQTAWWAREK